MTEFETTRHQIRWSRPPRDVVLSDRNPLSLGRSSPEEWTGETPTKRFKSTIETADLVEVVETEKQEILQVAKLLERITQQLEAIDARRSQLLEELQQVALELAIAAASHLAFQAIQNDQFGIEELIASAIASVDESLKTTVVLHPDDSALLFQRSRQSVEQWSETNVVFVTDKSLARGACDIRQLGSGNLVTDIGTRLSEIRRHWMEELDDTQVERRETQEHGKQLRRFPDRRETA